MILSPSISSPLSIPEKTLRGTISYFRHGEWLPKERLTMCYLLNFISYNVIYITSHITFLLLYVSPGHLNVVYPAAKFASESFFFFFFALLVIVRSPQSYTVSRKILPYPIASRLPGRIKAR